MDPSKHLYRIVGGFILGIMFLLALFISFFKNMNIYHWKDWVLLLVALAVVAFFIIKVKKMKFKQ